MSNEAANDGTATEGAIGRPFASIDGDPFFTWFHLVPSEAKRELGEGRCWHGFRPEGARFNALVTLNLETDAASLIERATLCLDRGFIERPADAPFARDIAKSFFNWALSADDRRLAAPLIDEIGDLRRGPGTVIQHTSVPQPELPRFPSPGYRCFLGHEGAFDQDLGQTALRLVNLNWQRRPLEVMTPPGYDSETMWIWLIVRRLP
jgi:hypothetical protein